MDTEQQVRLKFLEEAEDCLDRMESILLNLGNTIPDPQELDQALRAAHSVKGGAAMMGFMPLSQVAHRLEDYFKILRVRHHTEILNTEVETLLLKGLDCLRQVSEFHRKGISVDEGWMTEQAHPIFEQLYQHLGALSSADEDALLSQEEDIDPALLMFECGVEDALERFKAQLSLPLPVLAQELTTTAHELADFGRMAKIEAFIQLCQSIEAQANITSSEQIEGLACQALKLWSKSLSLVSLRRLENLPTQLSSLREGHDSTAEFLKPSEEDFEASTLADIQIPNLAELQAAITDLNIPDNELPDLLIQEVQEAIADLEIPELKFTEQVELKINSLPDLDSDFLSSLQDIISTAITQEEIISSSSNSFVPPVVSSQQSTQLTPELKPIGSSSKLSSETRQTVRVPVEYLQQFNTVFGQLILGRNAINLRLEQLQNLSKLLKERMQRLELSNQQLRQWYDHASLEGFIPLAEGATDSIKLSSVPVDLNPSNALQEQFDVLEMDRYSNLHLLSQEQIETIVQLQEVTNDIDLSLQDMTQSVRDLNQTTRSLQSNVTRTQMVPFADAIKRFPRVIRDLSVQFGKQVNLQIKGEATLMDRVIVENLSDPLLHLLRNAFDHGIETPEARLAVGKAAEGTITLQASHRGGQTIITMSDDGGGIQLDRIRTRLKTLGLPHEQVERLQDSELLDFIFEPGFSTANTITELSGRGVGMDVVRTNLQKLRGEIAVATTPYQGTTFTIRVPFTLSILRVMLVERSGLVFAISVDNVKEIARLLPAQTLADMSEVIWNQQTIPLIRLEQNLTFSRPFKPFELLGTPAITQPTVLFVGEEQAVAGFCVDRFWGEQEVALRVIETPIPLLPGFGNSIILGDGRVVPLIDPIQLVTWIVEQTPSERSDIDALSADRSQNSLFTAQDQINTVLVVDDSINVRRYLALTLEKAGYQVEQARDGQEAVERLLGGLNVQAMICDIEMPRLDGYGVLEALRSQPSFEHLPIAMLTSRSSPKHRKLAMNLGASAYFSKPYTEQELLQTLKALIQ